MRARMALVLHLGGVGEYMRQILGWYVHSQESGDLHTSTPQKGRQISQVCASDDSMNLLMLTLGSLAISPSC
jgi:hypothetical protein